MSDNNFPLYVLVKAVCKLEDVMAQLKTGDDHADVALQPACNICFLHKERIMDQIETAFHEGRASLRDIIFAFDSERRRAARPQA